MDTATVLLEAGGRWAVYLAVLPLIGLVSWRWLLWPRAARAFGEPAAARDSSLARCGVVLGLVLLFALGLRVLAQTANAFGPSAVWELDSLRTVAITSRWGGRFLWQVWAACGAVLAFAWIRLHGRSGWALAGVAGAALCVALPRTGHAMSHGAIALGAQALHVLGAGLWIGTLAVAVCGRQWGLGPMWPRARAGAGVLHALHYFAPVAIAGAAVLVASGAVTAYLYLPDLPSLVTTSWGRTLLFKVSLVAAVGTLGFLNFRCFREPVPHGTSLRLATVELALALAVVLAAAILTALPSPGG